MSSDPTRIQFFIRIFSSTRVFRANSTDSIRSIHERIESSTGIPIIQQRLIYRRKQLDQLDQTLHDCGVENDSELQLVDRLIETASKLVNDVVSHAFHLSRNCPPPRGSDMKLNLLKFVDMMPRDNADLASEHLELLTNSSVPEMLVMLYESSHVRHSEAADEAIREFISISKTVLPEHTFHRFAPIVFEFCTLIRKAGRTSDPLYHWCWCTLQSILRCSECGAKKGVFSPRIIFSVFKESVTELSRELDLCVETTDMMGPSPIIVRNFTDFLARMREEINRRFGYCYPIKIPLSGNDACGVQLSYEKEIIYLREVFKGLLSKVEKCLVKIENHGDWPVKPYVEAFRIRDYQYLELLLDLNSISKHHYACEDSFWETLKQHKTALSRLIMHVKMSCKDDAFINEFKKVMNFEARRHLAMMMFPEKKHEYELRHEMLIDRSHLLAESFEYIVHADPESLHCGLFMEFKNEDAVGYGVVREWFFLVCQEIANPQNNLFLACPNDQRRIYPNPASSVDSLHLQYFRFCGRVIALALMHKVQVGIVFDRVFFLQLAGLSISLKDIQDADPDLYRSCKQILEMDPEAVDQDVLGLTFVHEIEELGTRKVFELCPNGRSKVVNSKNRNHFVDFLIQYRFVTAISEQIAHFARGFSDIMSCRSRHQSFFHCLDLEDFDLMLHGSGSAISVDDWKAHTEYRGFKETDPQISWFWEIVGSMSTEQKKVLLFFWTSIKYLPFEGFGGLSLRLCISKTYESCDRLPSSRTCFYMLRFPAYRSFSATRDRLNIITQEHVGCSFGNV